MTVSIILPVRNEAATIREVLTAILQQDYARELIEVVLADGMSEDGTREIVRELAETDSRLRMVDNPKQITPAGLNLAIRESRGEVIVRVDGHGVIPPNYVRECVVCLASAQAEPALRLDRAESDAILAQGPSPAGAREGGRRPSEGNQAQSNIHSEGQGVRAAGEASNPSSPTLTPPPPSALLAVGGAWDSVGCGLMGEAIAVAMSSKFGVGNSPYRILETGWTPVPTDTVPFWAIHRRTFERVGLFREEFVCHEDYEFNHRLRSAGGRIMLLPWLRAKYYVRSTLGALARQYWRYGNWKGRFVRSQGGSLKVRHLIPPLFVAALALCGLTALFSEAGRIACCILIAAYLCFLSVATVTLFLTHHGDHQSRDSSGQKSPIGNRQSQITLPPSALRPLCFTRFALLPVILATLHLCWGAGVWMGLMRGKVVGQPPRLDA